jgi:mono/diheme cytochrome c family protein
MSFHCRVPGWGYIALALALAGLGVSHSSAAAQEKQGRRASTAEYEGWRQYMVNCARCHGDDAVGGVIAPDLRTSVAKGAVNAEAFHAVVSTGRREKGMPAFKGILSDEQIAAIHAYVNARAAKQLPAGRPRK